VSWQGIMYALQSEGCKQKWQPRITALMGPSPLQTHPAGLGNGNCALAARDMIAVRVVNVVVLASVQSEFPNRHWQYLRSIRKHGPACR